MIKFAVLNLNCDGVGGPRIINGETYISLFKQMILEIEFYANCNRENIEAEEIKIFDRYRRRKRITGTEIRSFNLSLGACEYECQGVYLGYSGFLKLLEYLKAEYYLLYDDSDTTNDQEDIVIDFNAVDKSYGDSQKLNSYLELIQERLQCN